jgi:hypothetical protein
VARKHFGVFEGPICENVSIFRRLSQGCFVAQSKPDKENSQENNTKVQSGKPLHEAIPDAAASIFCLAKGSPEVSRHIANEAVNGHLRDAVPDDCVHGFSQWAERWFVDTLEVQLCFSRC